MKSWVLPASLLLINFLYAVGILFVEPGVLDHLVTIAYLTALVFTFVIAARVVLSSESGDWAQLSRSLVLGGVAGHLGLLLGFAFSNSPEAIFWNADSYSIHLPGAKNVASALRGEEPLRQTKGGWDAILFTHLYVGTFFAIFGAKPWVSSLAMLVAKTGTYGLIIGLGRRMFSMTAALIALLTYILMPTITFYTTTFYKEALIQFFVALSFLGLFLLIAERKYIGLLLLGISLGVIAVERFYLFPAYIIVLAIAIWLPNESGSRGLRPWLLLVAGAVGVGVFYWNWREILVPSSVLPTLKAFRESFNNYSDVNREYSADLFYPLAVVKIVLTPFFTLRKFSLYGGFSYLLLWGALPNHVVIVGAMWSLFSQFKINVRRHWYMWVPFLSFILLFAYLAPFSGRQRDTFYPLLAIYFAALFVRTNGFAGLRKFIPWNS